MKGMHLSEAQRLIRAECHLESAPPAFAFARRAAKGKRVKQQTVTEPSSRIGTRDSGRLCSGGRNRDNRRGISSHQS